MSNAGRLWGIGVGPGDPELLTLKAVRLIREADVLAYVAPDGRPSLARAIAAPHLPGGQREVAIPVPMDPDARLARDAAWRIEPLAAELSAGRDVALLCEGDPLLYGSFIHLLAHLAGRFAVEVVPGVTSITAAAAAALLPLAARDATLTVLPATLPADRLADHLRRADAAAVLKLGRHVAKLRTVLADLGLLDSATYVERATQPGQRVLPLALLEGDAAPYFSLALVVRR